MIFSQLYSTICYIIHLHIGFNQTAMETNLNNVDEIKEILKHFNLLKKSTTSTKTLYKTFGNRLKRESLMILLKKGGVSYRSTTRKQALVDLFVGMYMKVSSPTASTFKIRKVTPEGPKKTKKIKTISSFDASFCPDDLNGDDISSPKQKKSKNSVIEIESGTEDVEEHITVNSEENSADSNGKEEGSVTSNEDPEEPEESEDPEEYEESVADSDHTHESDNENTTSDNNVVSEESQQANDSEGDDSFYSNYIAKAKKQGKQVMKKKNEGDKSSGRIKIVIARSKMISMDKNRLHKFVVITDLIEIRRKMVLWCLNGDHMKEVFQMYAMKTKFELFDSMVLSLFRRNDSEEDNIMHTPTKYKMKGNCICVTVKGSIERAQKKFRKIAKQIETLFTDPNFFKMIRMAIDGYNIKTYGSKDSQNRFQDVLVENYKQEKGFFWLSDPKYYEVDVQTNVKISAYFREEDIKHYVHPKLFVEKCTKNKNGELKKEFKAFGI